MLGFKFLRGNKPTAWLMWGHRVGKRLYFVLRRYFFEVNAQLILRVNSGTIDEQKNTAVTQKNATHRV